MTKKKTPDVTLPDAPVVPTIREFILGCPADMPAAGVVKEAKKAGVKTTPQYVYRVRSLASKKGKKTKKSKATSKAISMATALGKVTIAAGAAGGKANGSAPHPKSALEIFRTSVKALGVLVDSGFMTPKDAWTFLENL